MKDETNNGMRLVLSLLRILGNMEILKIWK